MNLTWLCQGEWIRPPFDMSGKVNLTRDRSTWESKKQEWAQSCRTDYYPNYMNAIQSQGITKPNTCIHSKINKESEQHTFYACLILHIWLFNICFTSLIMILILFSISIIIAQLKMNLLQKKFYYIKMNLCSFIWWKYVLLS